jgi:carbon storage regulator
MIAAVRRRECLRFLRGCRSLFTTRTTFEKIEEGTMLVLSRHRDESIMIGDDVVVTIVDIRGDKVRLGIDAPQSIPVHRQEVYEAIQRENRRASQTDPEATRTVAPPREARPPREPRDVRGPRPNRNDY